MNVALWGHTHTHTHDYSGLNLKLPLQLWPRRFQQGPLVFHPEVPLSSSSLVCPWAPPSHFGS